VCYDFHSRIFNEEEDMMFVIELDLFSIWTMIILTHISLKSRLDHISNIGIVEQVSTKPVVSICVLVINLTMPLECQTTFTQDLFPYKNWKNDYWWDICLGAHSRSNHS
jgi:hypothetical protein